MGEFFSLTTSESRRWQEILDRSHCYDFYHRPDYHRIAEEDANGRAHLFVYDDGDDFIALPLLLRPVPTTADLGHNGWWDATSAYGYTGPVASTLELPAKLTGGFQEELSRELKARRVVSVFTRLHPLIAQEPMLGNLGDHHAVGQTVSIDLTVAPEERRKGYRANHRRDIERLRESGAVCEIDPQGTHLSVFATMYRDTMARVGAEASYFFDDEHFRKLFALGPPKPNLVICRLDREPICVAMFFQRGELVQYHLSGTARNIPVKAPLKLVLDYAADWYSHQGARIFHLGGGVGGRADSLLHFKRGFSDRIHEFRVWQWVLGQEVYVELSREFGVAGSFFPAYRTGRRDQSDEATPGTANSSDLAGV